MARRPKLSRRSAFALRASVDSLRGYESEGWVHIEFTPINIKLTILPKKIEEQRAVRAFVAHKPLVHLRKNHTCQPTG